MSSYFFLYLAEKVSAPKVINMIIIYGIKAGNDCPAIKVPSCERTVGPRAVVSIRELDKHLQSKKADCEAF